MNREAFSTHVYCLVNVVKDTRTCRLLWLAVFTGALILFIGQVGSRMEVFFEYKTNVAVTLKYAKQIEFPSVTLCNQNSYR